jgi:hypothetical protein
VRLNKKFAAIALTASVALTASAAFAYFTATGSGSGAAQVGTSSDWVISNVSTNMTNGPLVPGAGVETLDYKVTNPSAGNQNLNSIGVSVAQDGSGNVLSAAAGNPAIVGCLKDWFVVDNALAPATGDYAAHAEGLGSASITMSNAAVSQDACKLASPKLLINAS